MPINGTKNTINEEGQDKEAFVVTFTNGALQQLEDLRLHYSQPDLNEVIKLGISLLQQIKEQKNIIQK